jgi:hypothetical protein
MFNFDETEEHLGKALKLPAHFEQDRERIQGVLTPVTLNTEYK